jgi:hypothetical protein
LSSANGHFDNLCFISADKIKTLRRPKSKRCLRADREQITLRADREQITLRA